MEDFLNGLPPLPPLVAGLSSPPQALPTMQQGPVPMSPAMPAVPRVQPPQRGGGTLNVLSQLAPMVMAAFRARKDPAGAAALMQGLIRGHEVARAQQLDIEKREQEKRELSARYLQQVAGDASQFDDLDEFQRFLSYHEPVAQSLGIDAGQLRKIPFATSKATEKKRKLASERLASLEGDPRWASHVGTPEFENGFSVEVPGLGVKTVKELRAIAQQQVFNPQGQPFQPPAQQTREPYRPGTLEWKYANAKSERERTLGRKLTPTEENALADELKGPPPPVNDPRSDVERGAALLKDITAAERAGDTKKAAELKEEYDRLLRAKRDIGRADDRPPTVITTGGGLSPRIQSLVDGKSRGFESNRVVLRTQLAAEAVEFADSLDTNTQNPADDQALIYAFAKAMDPESVVREGEYATVQKYAQSWAQTFGFNAQRVFSNTAFLTPQARANMKATIRQKYAASRKQYDNIRRSYADQINRITGQRDGDAFLIDHAAAFPLLDGAKATAPNNAPASAAPSGPQQQPIPGIPGGVAEFRNGKWIRVK